MKISNSKKQLAKIISENGGWQSGKFCAQQDDGEIWFSKCQPRWNKGQGTFTMHYENHITAGYLIANRHQTILSRAEYFHLYPAPDADGWIEWKSQFYGDMPCEEDAVVDVLCGTRTHSGYIAENFKHWGSVTAYRPHKPEQQKSTAVGDDETNLAAKEELEALAFEPAKPTIEQLAADYRAKLTIAQQAQEEADSHRCGAEAALEKLVAAGKAHGLTLSVAAPEPELVIADWRDLQVGDEVACLGINITGDDYADDRIGSTGLVVKTEEPGKSGQAVKIQFEDGYSYWVTKWRFIRRP